MSKKIKRLVPRMMESSMITTRRYCLRILNPEQRTIALEIEAAVKKAAPLFYQSPSCPDCKKHWAFHGATCWAKEED